MTEGNQSNILLVVMAAISGVIGIMRFAITKQFKLFEDRDNALAAKIDKNTMEIKALQLAKSYADGLKDGGQK